jgi:putative ABC transport system permease protein
MRSPFVAATLFWSEAFRALSRHRFRSTLTALGVAIGIGAVVAVVAIGRTSTYLVEEQLRGLGENLVWVEAGSRNLAGVRTGSHVAISLTMDDAEAILREVPAITSVTPQIDGNILAVYGNRNWTTHYRGVSPDFLTIRRWTIAEGAAFTEEDVLQATNVCLLGQTARERLFGKEDPIGERIRLQNQICVVVGVLGTKGQSGWGQDQDDAILLPYTTVQRKIRGRGYGWLDDIMCSAASPEVVGEATEQIIGLIRQRHHIHPGDEDDFNIRKPEELIKSQIEASQTLEGLLIALASISLIIGGIGIMNVMLVSVTERTREIGIRLAVGATEWTIEIQFLGEACMLSAVGGSVGLFIGIAASYLMGDLLALPVFVPPQALVVAPIVSIGVGIFFGMYPAWRAAQLDPIAALRYE